MFYIPQWTQEQLQLHEELYSQTVEAGRQILPFTDAHTQTCLQAELNAFMETWERSCGFVEKRKALADTITHVCDPVLTSFLTFTHLMFYRGVMVQEFVPKIFSTALSVWYACTMKEYSVVLTIALCARVLKKYSLKFSLIKLKGIKSLKCNILIGVKVLIIISSGHNFRDGKGV